MAFHEPVHHRIGVAVDIRSLAGGMGAEFP
jgi:hypothetical protein